MKKMLFDTDVLIEYLRGKDEAQAYIDNISDAVYMSSITMAELYAGVRKGEELKKLEIFIETLIFPQFPGYPVKHVFVQTVLEFDTQ